MLIVADEDTFKRRFAIFTAGQFEGWTEWSNMVVIGGSVVGALLPVPPEHQHNEAKYFHEVSLSLSLSLSSI